MKRITKIAAFISSLAICAGVSACGSTRSGFEQTGGTQKLEKGATIGERAPYAGVYGRTILKEEAGLAELAS